MLDQERTKISEEEKRQKSEEEQKDFERKKVEAEEIKEKEAKKALQNNIILAAQDVLGDYLTRRFSPFIEKFPSSESFFRNFAPYVIKFSYVVRNQGSSSEEDSLNLSFVEANEKLLDPIFKKVYGGDYSSTDFFKPDQRGRRSLTEVFPEYSTIQILNQSFSYSHPFDVVMMLEADKKPLITMATKMFLDSNPNLSQPILGSNGKEIIRGKLCSLENVLKTAKQFNITDIKDSIAALNSVIGNLKR